MNKDFQFPEGVNQTSHGDQSPVIDAECDDANITYNNKQRHNTIFISYRRSASRYLALMIFKHLQQKGYDVFIDTESLGSGTFGTRLEKEISSRAHFIFVISEGSLQRCKDPGDWLRREFEEAFRTRRNIVPIYDVGVEIKSLSSLLDGELKRLPDYNGITMQDGYYDAALERMRSWLDEPLVVQISQRSKPLEKEVARKINIAAAIAPPTDQQQVAEKAYNAAWKTTDNDKRISLLSDAVSADPTYTAAYLMRGDVYRDIDDLTKAFKDYDYAYKLDPNDPEILIARAKIYKRLDKTTLARKDFEKAIPLYTDAISSDPYEPRFFQSRAACRYHAGDTEGAISDCNHVIEMSVDKRKPPWEGMSEEEKNLPVIQSLWHRGLFHLSDGNYQAAIDDCNDLIRMGEAKVDLFGVLVSQAYSLRASAHAILGNRLRAVWSMRKSGGGATSNMDESMDLKTTVFLLLYPLFQKYRGDENDDLFEDFNRIINELTDDL